MHYSKSRCWWESYFIRIAGLLLLLILPFLAYLQNEAEIVSAVAYHPNRQLPLLSISYPENLRVIKSKNVLKFLPIGRPEKPSRHQQALQFLALSDPKHSLASTLVGEPIRIPKEEGKLVQVDNNLNKIAATHSRFPHITGEGLVVSIKEKAFDKTNIDFKGRIVNPDQIDALFTAHATNTATLIAGAGNTEPDKKGVAWKARLASAKFDNLFPDSTAELMRLGISVQNHSYGVNIENYYGLEAQAYDQQSTHYPSLLHVFSSGNMGDQTSTVGSYATISNVANLSGQFKMSKNSLCVGAVDESGTLARQSSRGPAYDGRVKPEIVAYGSGGTSESAALVSGMALLVQQAYQTQHTGKIPPASLVKAVLLNSAEDIGRPEVDFETGFGNANALGAVKTIMENRFFTDSLTLTEERIFTVLVPAACAQLKATLVWHDLAAQPNATQALLNDLDLELVHLATQTHWKPWVLNHYPHPDSLLQPAQRQADHLNNVEQVSLNQPQAGKYELHVRGYQVPKGAQAFSLAFEVESSFDWTYPTREDNLLPKEPVQLHWNWAGPSQIAQLDYKDIGSKEWVTISKTVNLSQLSYDWEPANTITLGQFRLISDTQISISDTFSISQPISLKVGLDCPKETLLYWPAMPGIKQYQLFTLGETHAVPFLLTADTSVILRGSTERHYAVAPVIQGIVGMRSIMINSTQQGAGCYIQSFLPRQLVADTVTLEVTLGSLYRLKAIHLEKWDGALFQVIQTVSPLKDLQVLLSDQSPYSGKNMYRVSAETDQQEFFYSQPENVFFMQEEATSLLFPNPVEQGQILSIIDKSSSVRIRLYDSLGYLLSDSPESGVVKNIPTNRLNKGLYFIRVQKDTGQESIGKFMVQ